jgi:uncharacterized membrane protein YeaQ/YmgE (transglycosylase-associated protein family)
LKYLNPSLSYAAQPWWADTLLHGQRARRRGAFIGGGSARHAQEVIMSVLAWMVLGLIAGFIGSKIVNKSGEGFVLDIVLGIIGAVVGGYLFNMFGAAGVTGLNIYSLFVSVIGAMLVLVVYHAVRRPA